MKLFQNLKVVLTAMFIWCCAGTAAADSNIEFAAFSVPADGRIVLPVVEGDRLTGVAADIDERTNGALTVAAKEAGFTGESGAELTLYGLAPYARIDLVGVGSEELDRNSAEDFGGTVAAMLADLEGGSVQILWQPEATVDGATAARVALGYQLRDYRFDAYQEDQRDPTSRPVIQLLSDDNSAAEYFDDLTYLADAVYFARNMSSEPANTIYPESFVERAAELFDGLANVRIKVLKEREIQRLGLGAHWGVGKGSVRPPRLLIIEYMAGADAPTVVLAGKGITFDTGGISLKKNDGMWAMKGDLGGAGVVTGAALAAAQRGAAINLIAISALAENMPSGLATRPGDILTTMSGKTVEILSTDAEGRLVLADAVHYAQQEYQPDVLIDVATLTGAVGRALGDQFAGVFGRHDEVVNQLIESAEVANEALWRLPLIDAHFKQIKSDYADIKNSGTGSPGASTGAAFIGAFVDEDQVWAHLDIASVDLLKKHRATIPKGYSGWGVRTLDEYLRRFDQR